MLFFEIWGIKMQLDKVPVPRLSIAHKGPLQPIEEVILNQVSRIESWFREQWLKTPAPITTSVDLRNAGFKIAPVDTNLFPAGFNNLNEDVMPLCIQAVQAVLHEYLPSCRRVLILPELHTRNQFYAESLLVLRTMFEKAGFEVRLGNADVSHTQAIELSVPHGERLMLEPLLRDENRVKIKGFDPCFILLNNDLSSGVPKILEGVQQRIKPTEKLGWASRLKSSHFSFYAQIAKEFSQWVGIDEWLLNPMFTTADKIDFMAKEGLDSLAESVDTLLERIKEKYLEFNIKKSPFVVIKADNGTYGMSVFMVDNADQIRNMNRKQRTKMSASKGSQQVSRVIIQEGVHTFETMPDGAVAEPVVYMIGPYVVGGFYRVHQGKGMQDNLNAPGMHFSPLAFDAACNTPNSGQLCDESTNRFYTYGVIARLASLAAAREVAAIGGDL